MLHRALLVALSLISGLVPGAAAAPDPVAGLALTGEQRLDDRLTELTFTTPALADPVRVRVLVPRDAAEHPERRYPALYLLHGSQGDASGWTDLQAERLTEGLGVVVVMPDGGSTGWYTNWFGGGQPQWERFHVQQLIPWIDAHEPTIAARGKRAIAGLSMGGFGAMSYAARHPDLFVAAASYSGAVDLATPPGSAPDLVQTAPWGPWDGPEIRWRGHNPVDLARNLRGLDLSIYTGNGRGGGPLGGGEDGLEKTIHAQSASLAGRLSDLGITRKYEDYGAGSHLPAYWTRDLEQTLPGLMDTFAHPPAPPSPFSFTATERTFSVRGYTVRSTRDALTFRTLSAVRTAGFDLSTDAPTTVTTGRRYVRLARYRVRVRRPGRATVSRVVRSSADGRLTVLVPGSATVGITRLRAAS
jgi:S-formylglutathione hydrolase FrmB